MAPVFQPLLAVVDDAANAFVAKRLQPALPANRVEQDDWFDISYYGVERTKVKFYAEMAENLKRGIIYGSWRFRSPLGLLRNCLDYALQADHAKLKGVFDKISTTFTGIEPTMLSRVTEMNDFRNGYIAHSAKGPLHDVAIAKENLRIWIETLDRLHRG